MPHYRLIFPTAPGTPDAYAKTTIIESKEFIEVGEQIEHGGKAWTVTQRAAEQPQEGAVVDLRVWPAE
jgi:hypothetical protein